ncbi:hypothetical protein NXW84_05665 [Bacteroides fragilis]|nr:hypothetical protein NXW84_05665 [Bacteroides fragilis]
MAKASWCNVSPMSGKGDGVLTISAAANHRKRFTKYDSYRHGEKRNEALSQYSGISGRCRSSINDGYKQTRPSLFRRSR